MEEDGKKGSPKKEIGRIPVWEWGPMGGAGSKPPYIDPYPARGAEEGGKENGQKMKCPRRCSQWIDIKDRLPDVEEDVILFSSCRDEHICVGYRTRFGGFDHHPMGDFASGCSLLSVTHWGPLPQPPEKEE